MRTYDFTGVASFEIQENVLESTLELYTFQNQIVDTKDLTGMDLHWARINNQCLEHEIRALKNFINALKSELYQRVKIK